MGDRKDPASGPPNPTKGDLVGSGVKVVGAPETRRRDEIEQDSSDAEAPEETRDERPARAKKPPRQPARQRRTGMIAMSLLAAAGIAGTITFERAWSNLHGQKVMASQASQAATTFLGDLTNFNAKTVDSDFARLTQMATGPFAKQASQFFNSSIRQQLETALASSRGQVRNVFVQSVTGNQAQVYAVIDQLYVNRTLSAPQSDVLRVVVQMVDNGGNWKVSDVTVLEGPSIGSPSTSGG